MPDSLSAERHVYDLDASGLVAELALRGVELLSLTVEDDHEEIGLTLDEVAVVLGAIGETVVAVCVRLGLAETVVEEEVFVVEPDDETADAPPVRARHAPAHDPGVGFGDGIVPARPRRRPHLLVADDDFVIEAAPLLGRERS